MPCFEETKQEARYWMVYFPLALVGRRHNGESCIHVWLERGAGSGKWDEKQPQPSYPLLLKSATDATCVTLPKNTDDYSKSKACLFMG